MDTNVTWECAEPALNVSAVLPGEEVIPTPAMNSPAVPAAIAAWTSAAMPAWEPFSAGASSAGEAGMPTDQNCEGSACVPPIRGENRPLPGNVVGWVATLQVASKTTA